MGIKNTWLNKWPDSLTLTPYNKGIEMARHISEVEQIVDDAGFLVACIKEGEKVKKKAVIACITDLLSAADDLLSGYAAIQEKHERAVSDVVAISKRVTEAEKEVARLVGVVDSQRAMIDAVSDR
jgi:hypothetical protein